MNDDYLYIKHAEDKCMNVCPRKDSCAYPGVVIQQAGSLPHLKKEPEPGAILGFGCLCVIGRLPDFVRREGPAETAFKKKIWR